LVGRSIREAKVLIDVSDRSGQADASEGTHGSVTSAAFPLRSRGQVLGALIVRCRHPHGLGKESIDALQTIGRTAALALDNLHALEESQEALVAAQRAAGSLSLEAWAEVLRARTDLGFRGSERGVERATEPWSPRMLRAALSNASVLEQEASNGADGEHLTVPVRVQGEVIGVLDTLKPARGGAWTTDQVALVEQIAGQLSQALESARLYEETQRRGVRERQLREIGTRIGSGVDLDTILQTAIKDVAQALDVPTAFVQLYEGRPVDGPWAEQRPDG
jgi:GAF domain-containing protein